MQLKRRKSKIVKIGRLCIGGAYPIAVQSMTKTNTADIEATLKQIKSLESVGCDIVRLAINNEKAARAIKEIKEKSKVPLVADIHFDWRLACIAMDNGIDKIRLNPGNIYKEKEIREIVLQAKRKRIPIRIGANSGSLRTPDKRKPLAQNLVQSVWEYLKIIEGLGFYDLVISLKAPDLFSTIQAYRQMSKLCVYPLHLGLTATGSPYSGMVKSAIALGILLCEGIGDTLRVSLTDSPEEEVKLGKAILTALGIRKEPVEMISCPTCGRCTVDLKKIVRDFEEYLSKTKHNFYPKKSIQVAIMGCLVNGPGEAKQADLGIAFAKDKAILFKEGRPYAKINARASQKALFKEMEQRICKIS